MKTFRILRTFNVHYEDKLNHKSQAILFSIYYYLYQENVFPIEYNFEFPYKIVQKVITQRNK